MEIDLNRANFLVFLLLIVLFSLVVQASLNPLEGRRVTCTNEGEPIAVGEIDKQNCYSCICKNGFAECKKIYVCPPTEGCHLLVEKSIDGCCKKCKGCIYEQKHHDSHTEWTDPKNPCTVLRCEAGIVTISDLKCHTPCANPIPPQPGQCCPTCPECKINGQTATADRDVISDDPCVKCRCAFGQLTCAKRACPVLQCAPAHQRHPAGECCARCEGTRYLLPAPNTCMLQQSLYRPAYTLRPDRCTNCTCANETSVCARDACPVLNCEPDAQVASVGGCCKRCVVRPVAETRSACRYQQRSYENGESWQLDSCRSCRCENGTPRCAMTKCNVTLPCGPGFELTQVSGECCKKCVEVAGTCMVFGDPHYKTFDGKIYTFQGIGKYQLASDCESQTFQIRVANELTTRQGKTSVSTRRIAIRYGEHRLNLQQKLKIKHNKLRLTHLPYKLADGKLKIERVGEFVELSLQNGVKVLWNGRSFLEVTLPAAFKNRTCGLCGNFNGNVQDELRPRRKAAPVDSETVFAHSWCVGNCYSRKTKQSCAMHRPERNRCKFLTNWSLFGACDSKLNYKTYYQTCKMDSCNCASEKCYCDSLLAYSRECGRLGVSLPNWSRLSGCSTNKERKKPKVHRRVLDLQPSIGDFERRLQKKLNRANAPILID